MGQCLLEVLIHKCLLEVLIHQCLLEVLMGQLFIVEPDPSSSCQYQSNCKRNVRIIDCAPLFVGFEIKRPLSIEIRSLTHVGSIHQISFPHFHVQLLLFFLRTKFQ